MIQVHERLKPLYGSAAFWKGALLAREAGNGQHHDEAVTRLHILLDLAEAKQDVTASPEFERWLGYQGVPRERISAWKMPDQQPALAR